ncbi:hypothetical protein AVEN_7588-1, partial [Araneus ventricosus]
MTAGGAACCSHRTASEKEATMNSPLQSLRSHPSGSVANPGFG